jgi:ABC-type phosphate/phosphonate transport system permease subunit
MNLFQDRDVSLLPIIIFVIVLGVERMSTALRERLA